MYKFKCGDVFLTESQAEIIINLQNHKEIYYHPESEDIKYLVKNYLVVPQGNGDWAVVKALVISLINVG